MVNIPLPIGFSTIQGGAGFRTISLQTQKKHDCYLAWCVVLLYLLGTSMTKPILPIFRRPWYVAMLPWLVSLVTRPAVGAGSPGSPGSPWPVLSFQSQLALHFHLSLDGNRLVPTKSALLKPQRAVVPSRKTSLKRKHGNQEGLAHS